MIILKKVAFRNLISNNEYIEINFQRKYKEKDSGVFFNESLVEMSRSNIGSQLGLLKTIAIIGVNASYKTSILKSIDIVLNFVINFKKNVLIRQEEKFLPFAYHWYIENKRGDIVKGLKELPNLTKIYEEYKKENHTTKWSSINFEKEYLSSFFKKYAFDKDKDVYFDITFYDTLLSKETNFSINMKESNGKILFSSLIDGKSFNLSDYKNLDLNKYSYELVSAELYYEQGGSAHSLSNLRPNSYLDDALTFIFINQFNKDPKKMSNFLKIIDESIDSIDFELKNNKYSRRARFSIKRSYSNVESSIGSINNLSTGTKMFISYWYWILKNDLVLIDEIEQHMHIKLVEILLKLAAKNKTQIIFTTHSPTIINEYISLYQMYITEIKDKKLLISQPSNLKDINIRENNSFIKKYLDGLVCSTPKIDKMEKYIKNLGSKN